MRISFFKWHLQPNPDKMYILFESKGSEEGTRVFHSNIAKKYLRVTFGQSLTLTKQIANVP